MERQQSPLKTEIMDYCPLAGILAQRMQLESEVLTRRWLERINARVEVEPGRIFPSDELLNHVPLLILGVSAYLEDPERVLTGEFPVVAKAMELGHSQGFDAYELLAIQLSRLAETRGRSFLKTQPCLRLLCPAGARRTQKRCGQSRTPAREPTSGQRGRSGPVSRRRS